MKKRLSGMTGKQVTTLGGETVNNWIARYADMQAMLAEFQRREIFIKDLQRGLLDFPRSSAAGEVFFSAGNQTRNPWNSGMIWRPVLAGVNGCNCQFPF